MFLEQEGADAQAKIKAEFMKQFISLTHVVGTSAQLLLCIKGSKVRKVVPRYVLY